jgi:hypothetical protein
MALACAIAFGSTGEEEMASVAGAERRRIETVIGQLAERFQAKRVWGA